jgi:hypothetical protein
VAWVAGEFYHFDLRFQERTNGIEDAALGNVGVGLGEFDPDAVAAELVGDEGGGAAAEEGVQDCATTRAGR